MNKIFTLLTSITVLAAFNMPNTRADETVQLTITDGHQTDTVDHGRPVILIANALGVNPTVFRAAFSHVTPAAGGTKPQPEQVRQNKEALLRALSRYSVTNEQLDRVSDYYRYRPDSVKLWPTRPAVAHATLNGRTIKSITLTDSGSGYSSAPTITLPGHSEIHFEAKLAFGRDLKTNGSISAISILPETRSK